MFRLERFNVTYLYLSMHICRYADLYACVCICVFIYARLCTCMYAYACIGRHNYIYVSMYVWMNTLWTPPFRVYIGLSGVSPTRVWCTFVSVLNKCVKVAEKWLIQQSLFVSLLEIYGWLTSFGRIQRSAACLTGQIPKFSQVENYMLEVLYWLPVRQHIEQRVALLGWRWYAMPRSTWPNWPLSICVGYTELSLPSFGEWKGLLLVPFSRASINQSHAFLWWNR